MTPCTCQGGPGLTATLGASTAAFPAPCTTSTAPPAPAPQPLPRPLRSALADGLAPSVGLLPARGVGVHRLPPAHPWQWFGCWRLRAAADGWRGRVVAPHTIRATCAPPGCWQELCVRCACRAACVPARASWGGYARRSWGARRGPSPLPPAFPGTAGKKNHKKHKKVLERGRSAPTAAPKGSPHNAHGAEFPPGAGTQLQTQPRACSEPCGGELSSPSPPHSWWPHGALRWPRPHGSSSTTRHTTPLRPPCVHRGCRINPLGRTLQ